jgi:hypothetical protein
MRYGILGALALVAARAACAEPPDLASYLNSLAEPALAARGPVVTALTTRPAAEHRQAELRAKIVALIGGLPERSAPLNAKITGSHQNAGFRVETVVFESLPGYRITANVFVPAGKGPFPAVIVSPGHAPAGKASDYPFAANFARAGMVVLTYDIVGEGERLEHYDPALNASSLERPTGEHSLAAYQSLLTGQPVVHYFLNDAMAGVDYLQSRPEVDRTRIGAFGCSGGGAVTAYLAALDPRIAAAASACFVTTMHHLNATIGPQEGEQSTPGFTAAGLDLADWVELAAPKPYAIVSTTEDTFPFAGARLAEAEARRFWGLFGAADKLQWITGPGPHGHLAPVAAEIVAFFVDSLKATPVTPTIVTTRPERPEDLLATPTGQLANSYGSETIQTLSKARAMVKPATVASRKELAALQARLRRDIRSVTGAVAVPGKNSAVAVDAAEARAGYRRQMLHFHPAGSLAFDGELLTPDGAVKGRMVYLDRSTANAEALVKAGWQVLALIPAAGNPADAKAAVLGDYTLLSLRAMLVNRTIIGLRIDAAMAAADFLAKEKAGPLAIYGAGAFAPVALHAAMLDSRFTAIATRALMPSYQMAIEAPVTRGLPEIALPGVLQHYDLGDLVTALAPRPVVMIDPVAPSGRSLREGEFEDVMAPSRHNDAALQQAGRVRWSAYEPEDLFAP